MNQRQQAPLRTGGAKAIKELQNGHALTGPAQEAEQQVKNDLGTVGRVEIVTQGAVRLEAVARLYYNAVIDAAEQNDLEKLDSYVKRFGWLQGASLRAWAQVKDEQKDAPNTLDYEQMINEDSK